MGLVIETQNKERTEMQPMGRKPVKFPGKRDCHPPKGLVNWWEADFGNGENKKSARQEAKQAIRNQEEEYNDEVQP